MGNRQTPTGFDPKAFLQGTSPRARAQQAIPEEKEAKQTSSANFNAVEYIAKSKPAPAKLNETTTKEVGITDALLAGAGQGATLGFQDEAVANVNAAVESLREVFGGATTLIPGGTFQEKKEAELARLRGNLVEVKDARPISYILGQIAGGAPAGIAAGGTAGVVRGAATAAGQAGVTTVGEAEDKLSQETAKKAATSAILAGTLAGVLGAGGKILRKKGGDLLVRNGKKSFAIGKEMQESFSDPTVQRKVTEELVDMPNQIDDIIQTSKQSLGEVKERLLQENGDIPVIINLKETFGKTATQLRELESGIDDLAIKGKSLARQKLTGLIRELKGRGEVFKKDGNTLVEISLREAEDLKRQLGRSIYQQRVFNKGPRTAVPEIDRIMKGFERNFDEAIVLADDTLGSGELRNVNQAFRSLFDMEGKKMSTAAIKGISDPQNDGALKTMTEFFEEFDRLPNDVRTKYLPDMAEMQAIKLPNMVNKVQLMRLTTGRDPSAGFSSADFQRGAVVGVMTQNPLAAVAASSPPNVRAEALNRLGAVAGKTGAVLGQAGEVASQGLGLGARGGLISGSASSGQGTQQILEQEAASMRRRRNLGE